MNRKILHVDVNNAFLSWTAVEKLSNGEKVDIRTIPAIIGGDEAQRKGVVLAKSNLAKQFGIKTGEPIFFARKKCPQIQIFETNFKVYKKYSDAMFKILSEYTDVIERFSIDECFIDLTHFMRSNENLVKKAYEISNRIKSELGFTVNVGVSTNKILAKMASDFQKPDRVHTLFPEEIQQKMWQLPVGELFMVGRKSTPKLERLGIRTIGDLAKYDHKIISSNLGKFGDMIWNYANGIDDSEVVFLPEKPKGIGNSATFPYDINNLEKLNEALLVIVDQVSYRLRKSDMLAKVISVQIKNNKFEVTSHQKKLDTPTNSTRKIYEEAKQLLKNLYVEIPIRLLGVRVDNLCEKDEMQISLFDANKDTKQEKIDKTIDTIKEKYGCNLITRAGKMNANSIIKL